MKTTLSALPYSKESKFSFLAKRDRESFINLMMKITMHCILIGSDFSLEEEILFIDMNKAEIDVNKSNKNLMSELKEISDELSTIYDGLFESDNIELKEFTVSTN